MRARHARSVVAFVLAWRRRREDSHGGRPDQRAVIGEGGEQIVGGRRADGQDVCQLEVGRKVGARSTIVASRGAEEDAFLARARDGLGENLAIAPPPPRPLDAPRPPPAPVPPPPPHIPPPPPP